MGPTTTSLRASSIAALACFTIFATVSSAQTPNPSGGALTFVEGSSYIFGTPESVATGDFDGDGDIDIVVANTVANKLVVLRNNGIGAFFPPLAITTPSPYYVLVEDVNHDGDLDLVSANPLGSSISVFLGTGLGTFDPHSTTTVGTSPISIAAGDLNEDGFVDLAVANHQSNDVSLLAGAGDGTFTVSGTFPHPSPSDLEIADLDLDGHLDVVATTSIESNFSVRYGNGTGAFPVIQNYLMGIDDSLWSVAASDVTGDGLPDLVFPCPNFDWVVVYEGVAPGGFLALPPILTGDEPLQTLVGDFDSDGQDDVCVLNHGSGSLSMSVSDGSGNFSLAQNFPAQPDAEWMEQVDLDQDGQRDVIVVSPSTGLLTIHMNRTLPEQPFVRGDADDDGALTIADPVRLLSLIFGVDSTPLPCPDSGDADDSGTIGIGDPMLMLVYLFAAGPAPAAPSSCAIDPTPGDVLPPCTSSVSCGD